MIEMIAMTLDNNVIMVNNMMPLILESHLDRLRDNIKNKVVVMGKHTYQSLGEKNALGGTASRLVIMSRNMPKKQGIAVVYSMSELLENYKDFIVIGGSSLFYNMFMLADAVYITEVSERPQPGVHKTFPNLNRMELINPDAEFLHEGDTYYRKLVYKRG